MFVLLTVDGFHVPVIPFMEVAGKPGEGDPLHTGDRIGNVGVTGWLTVTISVVAKAHNPVAGVKV